MSDKESVPTLRPCPFCGGEAFLTEDDVSEYPADGKVWHVTCLDSCPVAPGVYAQETKDDAIRKWNMRATKSQYELLCDEHKQAFNIFQVGGCLKCWEENECISRVSSNVVAQTVGDDLVSDVDRWKLDLIAAGWCAESGTAWRAPDGSLWRGPFGAWKELHRRLTDQKRETFNREYERLCGWRERWMRLSQKPEIGRLASRQERIEERVVVCNDSIRLLMVKFDRFAEQSTIRPATTTPAPQEPSLAALQAAKEIVTKIYSNMAIRSDNIAAIIEYHFREVAK